ncbi:hypothetical protein ACFLTZ_06110 [Chloroflexota bacterium]
MNTMMTIGTFARCSVPSPGSRADYAATTNIIVHLNPPDPPKYRQAMEELCTKLNSLSTCFPETLYHIKFAVAGIEMHTKPHNSAAPMS